MNDWSNYLVFGWYPYVAFAVFLLGGWLRFDGEPHIQPDGSGRLLSRRQLTLGVTSFHAGVLILFLGHLVGLLTPIQVFESVGISHSFKQSMANVLAGPPERSPSSASFRRCAADEPVASAPTVAVRRRRDFAADPGPTRPRP